MNKTLPLISFIILYYNQKEDIKKLLSTIYNSTEKINFEIIIIDDGSDDLLQFCDYNIKIVRNIKNTKNQSFCRNLGIKLSIGKYIMFMDSDDIYDINNLKNFLTYLINKNNDVVFISSLHNRINGTSYITKYHNDINKELSHSIVQYCVKRNFLIKNNIYFDEKKYYYDSEDAYFFYKLLDLVDNYEIYDQNKPLAIIYQRIGNNTYTKFKNPNYKQYLYELCNDLNKICKKNKNIKYFLRNYYLEELKRIEKFNKNEKEHENF